VNDSSDAAPKEPRVERVLEGLGVAPGVGIGPAHVIEAGRPRVREYKVAAGDVAAERERFAAAVTASVHQLKKLQARAAKMSGAAAEELDGLLEASLQILSSSRLIRRVDERIAADRINAEAAVHTEIARIEEEFALLPDAYLAARAQDIHEVGARLIRRLSNVPYAGFADLPKGSIIMAHAITPADTVLMDPKLIGGFAAAVGGPESHSAIMARSLGLPAVLGIQDLEEKIPVGETVIVDGAKGLVIVAPEAKTLAEYARARRRLARERGLLNRVRSLRSVTLDGTKVLLHANVELPFEAEAAVRAGAEGIGLLRTEFLFMNRDEFPSEDEQFAALKPFVAAMHGKPVTIRTLDVGGDKLAPALREKLPTGANPALGLRAIRLSLKHRPLLEAQLAAILRVGALGPVRILLPMVGTPAEIVKVRAVLTRVAARLKKSKVRIADPLPAVGAMIEVPAAALAVRSIAAAADFLSLGTNDLTMYTLAIDRGDEHVAELYDPLHPAVLQLIHHAIEGANTAGVPIALCGEMAGDPRYTSLLLGLGLRDFSLRATGLARIKQRVRAVDIEDATRRAHLVLEQPDSARVAKLLDKDKGS
jgi:phosphotransferase system enzyme I (PtsI)